ncbi:PaaI family thioesterase [Streptomyces xiaopingdaonensis]|uniref:PaaI family thioesterase n=1 Tax=Streptomyces xiaopingdaonensis TaxID=1565415 RepID=UPI0002F85405|nr:PaaI family thioesterase [Streptomyces xiaopingdaonensis]
MTDAEQQLAFAQGILAQQPFSVLLGARVTAFGGGEAVLALDVRDELRQQNGYLHGGVLSYAADNALTFAAGSVLGPDLLTVGFTIDYLRPGKGRLLRAHASVVDSSRSRATCRCELYTVDADGGERRCALAQGAVVVPGTARTEPQRAGHTG